MGRDDELRQHADFTLTDLQGNSWTLQGLRGKVVLVNFWATWCPPCRKEMPDLEALYQRFKNQGFVILGISDEEAGKVKTVVRDQPKVGRNDPCPCGSGKKYKKCHGAAI